MKTTLSGFSWMTGLGVLTKAVAVLKIAILARILLPSQFGAYGISLLVLGFLEMLTETGINIFLIQQKDDTEKYLNSAWVVSIIRGFLIAVIIVVGSPFIMSFFKIQGITTLFYLISAIAIVRGFINPMKVSFQKKLEFSKVFIFQGGLYFFDAIVSITLALATRSEASMLIGMLAAAVLEVILSFIVFKSRPIFKIEISKFIEVVNSGKWITGAGIFAYLFQNIDNATIGRLLGPASLGMYQQSYAIANLPVSGVGDVFNRVMFPALSKISENKEMVKQTFIKSILAVSIIAVLFGGFLFLFSHQIILLVLGKDWLAIEPTLKILSIFGVLKSLLNASYSLFLSLKMQKVVMLSEFVGILGMGLSVYPLTLHLGTVGAAYSAIIAVFLSLPVVVINVKKIFNLR